MTVPSSGGKQAGGIQVQQPIFYSNSLILLRVVLTQPGRIAQWVALLTQEPEVQGSIPGPTTYFCFSFC